MPWQVLCKYLWTYGKIDWCSENGEPGYTLRSVSFSLAAGEVSESWGCTCGEPRSQPVCMGRWGQGQRGKFWGYDEVLGKQCSRLLRKLPGQAPSWTFIYWRSPSPSSPSVPPPMNLQGQTCKELFWTKPLNYAQAGR